MFRVLVYVVLVFALAAGFAWLAERPGDLTLVWQGYRIHTSLLVAAAALVLALLVIVVLGALIRAVIRTPRTVGEFFGGRRRDRGYRALTRGMIAIGAGDPRAARKASEEARALLGSEPLVLLLTAQAAQIGGDAAAAREAFEALSASRDTRLLGLHGLFVEARRQNEHAAARHFAEEAMLISARIGWAGGALFDYQCQAHEWQGAMATLATNADSGAVDRERAKRLRAVLLTARAMDLNPASQTKPAGLPTRRTGWRPTWCRRRSSRRGSLSATANSAAPCAPWNLGWQVFPHPEIAEAYANSRPGDSARDRLKRVRKLAEFRSNNSEGAIAIARAAIDARDWAAARAALAPFQQSEATERVCLLMAEIEEGESGDQGRARTWLRRAVTAKRDPVWTADGRVFDAWAPVSPVSGRLDAFEWRVVADALPRPSVLTAIDGATHAGNGAMPDATPAAGTLPAVIQATPSMMPSRLAGANHGPPDDPGAPSETSEPPRSAF